MSQVVQAQCPHCQNVLRIPREWLARSMRCKHCKKTFEARIKASALTAKVPIGMPAPIANPFPIAKPAPSASVPQPAHAVAAGAPPSPVAVATPAVPAKPPSNNLFGFDEDGPAPTEPAAPPQRRKRGRGTLVLLLMFSFLFLLGAGGVGFVAYRIFNVPERDVPPGYAKGDNGPTDGAAPKNLPITDGTKDIKSVTPPPADNGGKKKKVVTKKDSGKDGSAKDGPAKKNFGNDPFPRRALLISVNNYLMWSTVHYGSPPDPSRKYPGSSTATLRDRLTRPPMNFPATQVYELSDAVPAMYKGVKAHSTQKSVLESTILDFLDSSREQDRIVVFFAGHAAHIENVSYLVPIDGNKNNMETLLPLKWVMDQMAKCKAQQKILVLDVFRFSPSRGLELPSPGEGEEGTMPEGFDKDLLSPPAGLQVWSACIKGQTAVELEEGSAFSQALCNSLQGGGKMTGISTQTEPIPIDALVTDVNQRLKELLQDEKRTQVSRLTGKSGERQVPYEPTQSLPSALAFKPPTVAGGEAAPAATVEKILDELRILPPVRDTRAGDANLLRAQNLPAFSIKKIDAYKAEGYQNVFELQKKYKDMKTQEEFYKEFPLRAAYFEALDALNESKDLKTREVLTKADADPKRKAAFLDEQAPFGISIFKLEQALKSMNEAAEKREAETSKRWQANFDYVQARLLSRLVYLFEYNYTIGQVRADNLPALVGTQSGWRVGISGPKINVTEPKAKKYAKDTTKLFDRIQKEYPDTPWALLAQRESMFAQGLAWKAKSD